MNLLPLAPEPLTAPALTSVVTGIPPHLHGATRNGLRVRPGLPSLPGILRSRTGPSLGASCSSVPGCVGARSRMTASIWRRSKGSPT